MSIGYNLEETALDHSMFGDGVRVGTIILGFLVDDIAVSVSAIAKDSITKPMVSLGIYWNAVSEVLQMTG